MSENADANLASSRDVQRSALRELVELARQSVQSDTQIEKQFAGAKTTAKKEFEVTAAEIEQRYGKLREELEDRAMGATRQVEDQYTGETNSLKESDANLRHKIEFENDSLQHDIKKQFNHANWVADSISDGAQHQAREDYRIARDQHAGQLESLSSVDHDAASVVADFGHNLPEIVVPENETSAIGEDAEQTFKDEKQKAEELLESLRHLKSPALFVGAWPYLGVIFFLLVGGVIGQGITQTTVPNIKYIGIGAGAGLLLAVIVGALLWNRAKKQIRAIYLPLHERTRAGRRAADAHLQAMKEERDRKLERADRKREAEMQAAKDKFLPIFGQAKKQHASAIAAAKMQFDLETRRIETQRSKGLGEANEQFSALRGELEGKYKNEVATNQQRFDARSAESLAAYQSAGGELKDRWTRGLSQLQQQLNGGGVSSFDTLEEGVGLDLQSSLNRKRGPHPNPPPEYQGREWDASIWQAPTVFPATIPFGSLEVNIRKMTEVPAETDERLALPETFRLPAVLALPRQASLLIQTDRAGHQQAMDAMRMVMARLLTSIPPGRAKFTIIDPVGLGQNFAGFMHLADHDESLVNSRIWTEGEHIAQRLADLTEHMETVIQKYLRNEFQTIDEYNAQAGELAEPYRFLVIADFPVGFEGETFRRLASIASSGPRCGVYTLVLRDLRQPLPPGTHIDELELHSVNLIRQNDQWVWKDDVFKQFPLAIDKAPDDATLIKLLDVVGQKAKEAKRVEVSFTAIAPKPEEIWSSKSDREIVVPIGRLGATRLQNMRLGRGVAQHALIAGKTGSGKSTLLHVLITNLALWYSPDEVEFYLVDFKKGVEFKTYATHHLPHARAIAVESDREFGLSVLQRLDAELTRRGELFRRLGVQDLAAYRKAAGEERNAKPQAALPRLPRTLLIIDEFQEFFSEDDKLAQDAALLMDRLVRQGRAFGIHVILGSQTLGGAGGLARSTLGQMAVRVALQTTEADSQLILGDNNSAARLLSRPGEAIYNDAGGLVEGNSPFQISWLNDDQRDVYLDRISAKLDASIENASEPVVFEGNAPSDIRKNGRLVELLKSPPARARAATAFLGDPVAIKEPTGVTFRRQAGSNMLIIGQQDESAMAMFVSTMVSLSVQHSANSALFYLLDGTPADSPMAGVLPSLTAILPHSLTLVDYRKVDETMQQLQQEMKRRRESEDSSYPEIYVLVFALQRYRMLRKSEDSSFSFGSDEEKKATSDQIFGELLRDGPQLGIHLIAWCDTPANVERSLDRAALREFDHRILFQMSANDSSNLIDSPTANRLGFHRALAFSEEHGTLEKFRPYGIPDKQWLHGIANQLITRAAEAVG